MDARQLSALRAGLKTVVPDAVQVVVQPHSIYGVNIKVVSPSFAGMLPLERRAVIEGVLGDTPISYLELLTPEENEEFGIDLKSLDPEDLPFWPEATGLRETKIVPRFDESEARLERPIVATFYSIRGGVGRTTCLAYTAHLLADTGLTVVAVDMDLEAPGLAQVFGLQGQMDERVKRGDDFGVVNLLSALDHDIHSKLNIRDHLLRVSEEKDLYCLPAGHVDRLYVHRLHNLHFERFYRVEQNPLHALMDAIKEQMQPDVILIDARTGITAHNAPLLFDLSDLAIIVFLPTEQTYQPFRLLWEGLLNRYNRRGYTPQFRFVVSPVPPNDLERKEFLTRGLEWAAEAVEEVANRRKGADLGLVAEDTVAQIFYQETLALAGRVLEGRSFVQGYQQVCDWIASYVPEREPVALPSGVRKEEVLDDLEFGGGAAELQGDSLYDFFVRTKDSSRAMEPDVVLVRGRKGTGKTALFRLLSERPSGFRPFIVTAPAPLQAGHEPFLDKAGFRLVEEELRRRGLSWSDFWAAYIMIRLHVRGAAPTAWRPSPELLKAMEEETCNDQQSLLRRLRAMFAIEDAAVILNDELRRCDAALTEKVFLLFDGMDTGFGSQPEDLKRRGEAVQGLFDLWTGVGISLKHLRMKIFLRSDIYRGISAQNKSHLFGRDVNLSWSSADFLRTVISQAWRSDRFKKYVKDRLAKPPEGPVETWSEETVHDILHLLVGERMKGGKAAFTHNWIWNRLADGNNDHSPRHLFQLFETALNAERQKHRSEPYERSIIRPRHLITALPEVSREAVDALKEEYEELKPLMEHLQSQRISPLSLEGWDQWELKLAEEAGLIFPYEEPALAKQRYAVPDLYLAGLGMSRRGQA